MSRRDPNRWKGLVLGAASGIAGVTAMTYYWNAVPALTGSDPRAESKPEDAPPGPLDSISLIGKHHEDGESSTAAVGRIIYRLFTGKEPRSKETRTVLSYLVHWVFSMIPAGIYGAARGSTAIPDIKGGLALGIGLWLFGDELTVPLLGLADGPTAYPPTVHIHGFGAHIAYGLTAAAVTQTLDKIL